MMYCTMCTEDDGGVCDRAYRVIGSVLLHLPDKGFWACLGDLPPYTLPEGLARQFNAETLALNTLCATLR